jgi:hypothetical protein
MSILFGGQPLDSGLKEKRNYSTGYHQGRISAALDIKEEKLTMQEQMLQELAAKLNVQAQQNQQVSVQNQQDAGTLDTVKQQLAAAIQNSDAVRQQLAQRMGAGQPQNQAPPM